MSVPTNYRVKAVGDGVSTSDSPWVTVALEVTILAPSDLVATISGNDHVLTWTDNSDNEDGFRVEVSFDGGTIWETEAEIGANLETYTRALVTTVSFVDTFTDTAGTLISNHVPDSNPAGAAWQYRNNAGSTTANEFEIHNNAMSLSTGSWLYTNWQGAGIDTGVAGIAQVVFTATMRVHVMNTQGSNMLWFAGTDPHRNGSGYGFFFYGTNQIAVFRYASGTSVNTVASGTFTRTDDTDYEIRIELDGDDIRVYIDDVLRLSGTDGTLRGGFYGYHIWYSAQGYSEAKVIDNMSVVGTLPEIPSDDASWENVGLLVEPINDLGSTSFTDTGPDSFTIGDFGVAIVSDTEIPFPGEKAIHLSGETGYLEIANQEKVTNWFIESWTLDIFFYNADASGWTGWSYFFGESIPILFNNGGYSNSTRYFGFGPDNTGNLKFYYWRGAQERVTTSLACSNQTWHHARLVHEKGVGIHIYLDGVHHNGGTATAVVGTPQFSIAGFPTYINNQYAEAGITNGYVAGIRVTSGIARSTGATHDAVTLPYLKSPANTVSLPNQADVLAWLDPADPTYMWQDIAKSIPVTAIGDPIAVWADKLGSGREWTQSDDTRRPTWEGTYVHFQADWLIGPDLSAFTTGSLVARVGVDDRGNIGGSGGGLFHFTSMNSSNSAGHYALSGPTGQQYSAFCNITRPAVGAWSSTDIGNCLVRHTSTYRHNGTNLTVRVNGTQEYNGAVSVGNLGNSPIIGSVRRSSVIDSWAIADAKIIGGGLVLYSTALSDVDLTTVESFVQNTYVPPIETQYRVIATAGAFDSDSSNVAVPVAPAPTFDNSLDPAKTGANIVLSDGNRTATGTAANSGHSKTVDSVSSGKWVLDVEMDTWVVGSGGNAIGVVGISPAADPTSNWIGAGAGAVGVWQLGTGIGIQIWAGSSMVFDPGTDQIGDGDIIRFVWDADTGKVWIARNNIYLNSGDPEAGTGFIVDGATYQGERFFAVGPRNSGNICKVQATEAYPLPAGFSYFG